jgi:BlaI family penicillinase repressor
MLNKNFNISEAELEIMQVLWKSKEPLTAQDVLEQIKNKDWKYSTIATLFGRMVEKGTVTYERRGRFFYYTPVVLEEAYKVCQAKNFISKLYSGSVKNLVASLFENNQMSDKDVEEIKKMFGLEG